MTGHRAILQTSPWQEILDLEGCNTCFSSFGGETVGIPG